MPGCEIFNLLDLVVVGAADHLGTLNEGTKPCCFPDHGVKLE